MPTTTLAVASTTASEAWPPANRLRDSCAKVEKVVYAPKKPTTTPVRTQAGRWCWSTSTATADPARKQPVTLIVNVLHGKTSRHGARSDGRGRSARARRGGSSQGNGDGEQQGEALFVPRTHQPSRRLKAGPIARFGSKSRRALRWRASPP